MTEGQVIHMRKLRVMGWSLLISGIAMLAMGRILAFIKVDSLITMQGPNVQFTSERGYWIDDHIIPPIDRGTPIELHVSARGSGGPIYVFLYPLSYMIPPAGEVGGSPIASGIANETNAFSFSGDAPIADTYVVEVISYNNTYTASLRSTFPPLYGLRVVTVPGLLFTPGGLAIVYYDRLRQRREGVFKRALGHEGTQ